jgi:hypothetical protein
MRVRVAAAGGVVARRVVATSRVAARNRGRVLQQKFKVERAGRG